MDIRPIIDRWKTSDLRYQKTEPYCKALYSLLRDFLEIEAVQKLIRDARHTIEEQFEYYRINTVRFSEDEKDYKDKYYCILFDNENHKCKALNDAWAVLMFGSRYSGKSSNRLVNALCDFAKEKVSEILDHEEKYPKDFIIYLKVQLGLEKVYIRSFFSN